MICFFIATSLFVRDKKKFRYLFDCKCQLKKLALQLDVVTQVLNVHNQQIIKIEIKSLK